MNQSLKTLTISLSLLFFLAVPAFAGVVAGKVNFTGTAPAAQKISMDADPYCAGAHAEAPVSEEVVLNADNTLQNVFVYVKEGLEGQIFQVPVDPVILDQKGCQYSPHVFGVQINQPVEIVNSDSTLHNVHGMPTQSKEFNLGMPIPGMKLKRTFEKPEVMVKFKCDVHPWMNAYVGVLQHSFYSVTDAAGTFEIKNLHAGNYVIEAWHEKFGTLTQNVSIGGEETKEVDFTFAG